ncbi:hypothetical protein [Bacillus pinisoli]|uniref:hypothetical protein n=1 Tax=Bacillus pinisoli TaxID=2901866 RepID=UPI001FF15914|nr:hypothetical protein [Bacillus pinisoli]
MKKIIVLLIFSFFAFEVSAFSLTWAYGFVVNDGKVYEVKEGLILPKDEVGKVVGQVETQADEYGGDYYGNASNYYDIGTNYYEIKGIATKEAIAVEIQPNEFVKAVFVHDAPPHFKNFLFSTYTWIVVGCVIIVLGIVVLRSRQA